MLVLGTWTSISSEGRELQRPGYAVLTPEAPVVVRPGNTLAGQAACPDFGDALARHNAPLVIWGLGFRAAIEMRTGGRGGVASSRCRQTGADGDVASEVGQVRAPRKGRSAQLPRQLATEIRRISVQRQPSCASVNAIRKRPIADHCRRRTDICAMPSPLPSDPGSNSSGCLSSFTTSAAGKRWPWSPRASAHPM